MKLPPAIFLDLDDTILAFTEAADACWQSLCHRYAEVLPGITAELLFDALSQSRTWFWSDAERHRVGRNDLQMARRRIVRRAFATQGIDEPEIALQLADAYTSEREELVRPFPGAIETLQELHQRGIQLALLTNGTSAFQRAKIDRFNLKQYFHCIVVEGEFGVGKPDKAVFTFALRTLNRKPQEVWMVGDNLAQDIKPSMDLGMQGIWVDYAQTGLPKVTPCIPSRQIYTLSELLNKPH